MCSSAAALLRGATILLACAWLGAAADTGELSVPEPDGAYEAWLVTYGPGDIYWQRFGHNAVWLREPGRDLDHTFNFGYFDFSQERFLARFVQGRMLYFSLAQPSRAEFELYQRENRTVTAQRLALDEAAYARLRDHLLRQVRPENREYLYDYYLDNCSTRVRDALDLAFGGALRARFAGQPARLNFRDHTRRLTAMDFWYYLGLQTGLGLPVDRDISQWEEMFIPGVVAEALAASSPRGNAAGEPLVAGAHVIFAADVTDPPATPLLAWPRYLLLGTALVALAWLAHRFVSPVLSRGLAMAWIMLAGTAGLVLAGLWGFTDHHAAGANFNLLLFNPLFPLVLAPVIRRPMAALIVLATLLAILQTLVPGGQFTLDVAALAAPLNLGAAAVLWRRGR